jgi:hypothetical protein
MAREFFVQVEITEGPLPSNIKLNGRRTTEWSGNVFADNPDRALGAFKAELTKRGLLNGGTATVSFSVEPNPPEDGGRRIEYCDIPGTINTEVKT